MLIYDCLGYKEALYYFNFSENIDPEDKLI